MTELLILKSKDAGVATLTLNSPGSYNALSTAMLTALRAELKALAKDAETRVVVLKAAGKAFCAGHDLTFSPEQIHRAGQDHWQ